MSLILGVIRRISAAWHADIKSTLYQNQLGAYRQEIQEYRDREHWYRAQIENLQAKIGVNSVGVKKPYISPIKPASMSDFENFMQDLSVKELKKMDEELTETITNMPAIIHTDEN